MNAALKIFLATVLVACATPAFSQERTFYGLLRARDVTPFGSLRLDMRPGHAVAIERGARCEVTSLIGRLWLEAVRWRQADGNETQRPASNIFSMIGAVPNTDWLTGTLELDHRGFIKTDHSHDQLSPAPTRFATSIPGSFAVGDCRSGSVKRVAAGVGEGAMVIHAIHQWLRATSSIDIA